MLLIHTLKNAQWDHRYESYSEICKNASALSDEQKADILHRFTAPVIDQVPNRVPDGEETMVTTRFPGVGFPIRGGFVTSNFTIRGGIYLGVNKTELGHFFHPGKVFRQFAVNANGGWGVKTIGYGKHPGYFGFYEQKINEITGPNIMQAFDQQAADYAKTLSPEC